MGRNKKTGDLSLDDSPLKSERRRRAEIDLEALRLQRKSAGKVKTLLVILMLVSVASPIICTRVAINTQRFTDAAAEQFHIATANKPGRQTALQSVNKWLTGNDSPFQSGYANLWWVDARLVNTVKNTDETNAGTVRETQYWSHTMSLTDLADGSTRNIAQLVAISDGVPSPVGEPSILPMPAEGRNQQQQYIPDEKARLDQAAALQDVVNAWAKAYVGKDPSALTVLVGDPNTTHAYQPANVGTFKTASVDWLIGVDGKGRPVTGKDTRLKYGAAALTIQFAPWAKEQADNGAGETASERRNTTATMSISVLISNPSSGNARIVDWNANGATSAMKPYANAIGKEQLPSTTDDATTADDPEESERQDGNPADSTGGGSRADKPDLTQRDDENNDAGK